MPSVSYYKSLPRQEFSEWVERAFEAIERSIGSITGSNSVETVTEQLHTIQFGDAVIALVASEQLVLIYAQSGAGKSSLVNTRLIPYLESKAYEVLPVGRISGDCPTGIEIENIYIFNLLRNLDQHGTDLDSFAKLSLSDFLGNLNKDREGYF